MEFGISRKQTMNNVQQRIGVKGPSAKNINSIPQTYTPTQLRKRILVQTEYGQPSDDIKGKKTKSSDRLAQCKYKPHKSSAIKF